MLVKWKDNNIQDTFDIILFITILYQLANVL